MVQLTSFNDFDIFKSFKKEPTLKNKKLQFALRLKQNEKFIKFALINKSSQIKIKTQQILLIQINTIFLNTNNSFFI